MCESRFANVKIDYLISSNCCAMTDSTSMPIRLNSSRQVHAPCWMMPLNSFSMMGNSIASEQLNTRQNRPKDFARSLVDSVLPVPAGPCGAAPSFILSAEVMVIQHLSVSGVWTILEQGP